MDALNIKWLSAPERSVLCIAKLAWKSVNTPQLPRFVPIEKNVQTRTVPQICTRPLNKLHRQIDLSADFFQVINMRGSVVKQKNIFYVNGPCKICF